MTLDPVKTPGAFDAICDERIDSGVRVKRYASSILAARIAELHEDDSSSVRGDPYGRTLRSRALDWFFHSPEFPWVLRELGFKSEMVSSIRNQCLAIPPGESRYVETAVRRAFSSRKASY